VRVDPLHETTRAARVRGKAMACDLCGQRTARLNPCKVNAIEHIVRELKSR